MKITIARVLFPASLICIFLFVIQLISCKKTETDNSGPPKTGAVDHCYDLSGHVVKFITTEPGVKLEVLDWGGTGEYVVLLTGLGDNAHVFDNFAYQFNDMYHVIGITRRGFGKSSRPEGGYDEATRVRDYMSILDQLNIPKAYFIGHSIACGELSVIGAKYPDRVNKLVYLDGLDYGEHKSLKQPPSIDFTDADLVSLEHFISVCVRYFGFREPNAAICNTYSMDSEGRVVDANSPPEITAKLVASSVVADFSMITAPVLGIFEAYTMQTRLPYYWYLNKNKQAEYDSVWKPLFDWRARRLEAFRTEIKNCRVMEIPNFYHYVFINKEADVAREIRKFLSEK